MDIAPRRGDNRYVARPGASRRSIARTLNTAYADGLISRDTLVSRLDDLLGPRVVDPRRLIGDLTLRVPAHRLRTRVLELVRLALPLPVAGDAVAVPLLGLDWGGPDAELFVGRHPDCDIVLSVPEVSRRHARLVLRDGIWSVQDLESTNGTFVNGVAVGRYELRPGDCLQLGTETFQID